ncbi:acyltransferase family protein [Marinobacter zhejiangensis]|uniref:Peptidoglycan/LPS O-acetylase OafA/YrhL, contains acyltransferase and SGNH-hydrolase domains n=1 Tax=Marinobacter zhejiangensis TaxID=488535 RepID=A0A1I4RNP3_9GAMM|nr:acyltransferase [Marinobacter zhejiangensis]SFM53841.1 Peptidoglycan/LPS O-acetylase OafA/YrhL, contains acyltransferase and SGNH-hydrolase domains [Marinobacter zhejiangensis]
MGQSAQTELKALTSLRGIAALFVMFHHFMFVAMLEVAQFVPSRLIQKSYLWVDLFFVLSGFVLAYVYHTTFQSSVSRKHYWHFMQARFVRVYPLHIFMVLIFVGYETMQWVLSVSGAPGIHALDAPFTNKQSIETLITNVFLLQTFHWQSYWNEPAWSISAEWITYFVIPFTIGKVLRLGESKLALLAISALLPLIAIEWYFGDLGLYYAGWPMLIRCFCEATLGILAFRCYKEGRLKSLANAELLTPVLFLNLLILAFPGPGVPSVAGFVWLVLCASRLPSSQGHILNHPLLVYLGKISYSIYLVHWLFVDMVRDAGPVLIGTPFHETMPLSAQMYSIVAMTILTIGISALTYRYIEEPVRRRFRPKSI